MRCAGRGIPVCQSLAQRRRSHGAAVLLATKQRIVCVPCLCCAEASVSAHWMQAITDAWAARPNTSRVSQPTKTAAGLFKKTADALS